MVGLKSEQLIFRSLDMTVNLRRNDRGHLTVLLEKIEEWSTKNTVMYMMNENEVCFLEKIKKVHNNTNHKSEKNLLHAYKQANLLTDEARKHIKKVCKTCTVCQKYKKSQGSPKYALPKVTDFNQVFTLDSKHFGEKYVLWVVDSFTLFIQGKVIKNKQADTVVDALQTIQYLWFRYPSKGFWADNGNEFQNKEMIELMSKFGLII